MDVTLWHWLAFGAFMTVVLALDLGVFHRGAKETSLRSAAKATAVWVLLALAFNAFLWFWKGPDVATLFFTGYLVEWSLSMDNVFVFAVIFNYFSVPMKYQYRVLFWGIIGAVVMRLTFVLVGGELIERFEWIVYALGAFLVWTRHEAGLLRRRGRPRKGVDTPPVSMAAADFQGKLRRAVLRARERQVSHHPVVFGVDRDRRHGLCLCLR